MIEAREEIRGYGFASGAFSELSQQCLLMIPRPLLALTGPEGPVEA